MQSETSVDVPLAIGEAARRLGVDVTTIRRWEADGKITATRTAGGQRRFLTSEIDRLKHQPLSAAS